MKDIQYKTTKEFSENELRDLLTRYNIELTVFNKKEDGNGKIEPQSA